MRQESEPCLIESHLADKAVPLGEGLECNHMCRQRCCHKCNKQSRSEAAKRTTADIYIHTQIQSEYTLKKKTKHWLGAVLNAHLTVNVALIPVVVLML